MTAATLTFLFLGSLVLLTGLAAAALLIDSSSRERQRVGGRLSRLRPATGSGPAMASARLPAKPAGALQGIVGIVGCDYTPRHHYPMPWWIVPLLALVPARLAVWLCVSLIGSAAWVAFPLMWFLACRSIYGGWSKKHRDRLLKQLPDALAMIVRSVRVGVPVHEGIRMVCREAEEPTQGEFRQLLEEMTIGVPLDVALRATAERTGIPEYRFFATAVALQMQTGGGLSEALEVLADVVRRRLTLSERGYALTSEARSSAIVLSALPFLVALLITFTSPGYLDVLFDTPTGNKMLTIGIISLSIGIALMRYMIRQTLK
jgi:tight adherence protein B